MPHWMQRLMRGLIGARRSANAGSRSTVVKLMTSEIAKQTSSSRYASPLTHIAFDTEPVVLTIVVQLIREMIPAMFIVSVLHDTAD